MIPEAKYKPQQPTLLITCVLDYIAVAGYREQGMKPHVRDFTVDGLQDAGHWVQLERA